MLSVRSDPQVLLRKASRHKEYMGPRRADPLDDLGIIREVSVHDASHYQPWVPLAEVVCCRRGHARRGTQQKDPPSFRRRHCTDCLNELHAGHAPKPRFSRDAGRQQHADSIGNSDGSLIQHTPGALVTSGTNQHDPIDCDDLLDCARLHHAPHDLDGLRHRHVVHPHSEHDG
jgi:hypothetical protein